MNILPVTGRRRRQAVALSVALAAGFALRLTFAFAAVKIPFNYTSDSSRYYEWATAILDGKEYVDVYLQSPLYPYFLALIFSATGPSILSVLLAQVLLGTVSCYLVYLLGVEIFGNEWIGVAAAGMLALYGPAIFYSGLMMIATVAIFINLVFLLLLLKALNGDSLRLWAAAGFCLGLSALARGTALLFIPLLMLFLVHRALGGWRRRGPSSHTASPVPPRRFLYQGAAFLLGVSLAVSPVTLRNYVKGKDFALISTHFGITFFEGNNPAAAGYYVNPPGLDMFSDFSGREVAQYLEGRPLRPSEVSRFWMKRAWDFIEDSPGAYAALLARKLAYFWNRYEIPNAENIYFARSYSGILRLPLLPFLVLGPFGLLGMVLAVGKKEPNAPVAVLFLLSHMTAIVLFIATGRFRMPIIPVLAVFASYAAFSMAAYLRRRKFREFFRGLTVLALSLSFVAFPWPGLDFNPDYAASYVNLGLLNAMTGRSREAIRDYEAAMRYDPSSSDPYNNLGSLHYRMGERAKAMEYYEKGLQVNRDSPMIRLNRGNIYYSEGRTEQARREYALAAPHLPYSLHLHRMMDLLESR